MMRRPTADVAGDCRYWPPSSFLMSFYGPEDYSILYYNIDICYMYMCIYIYIYRKNIYIYILICRALGQAVCIAYKHTYYASLTPEATDWFRSKG